MRGGGGSDEPPSPSILPPRLSQSINNEGDFLLRLVQNQRQQPPPPHPHYHHTASQSPHNLSLDPAVAAVGPSLSPFSLSPQNPNFSVQRSPQNPPHTPPFLPAPHQHFDLFRQRQEPDKGLFGNIPFPKTNTTTSNRENLSSQLELDFERKNERELGLGLGTRERNGFNPNRRIDQRVRNTTTSNRENLSLQLELDSEIKNERELGLGLGTRERNGFNSTRRIDHRVRNITTSNRENLSLQLELDSEIKNERELGLGLGTREPNGFNLNRRIDQRVRGPPGFPGKPANQRRNVSELKNVGREVSSSSSTEFNNHRDFRFSSKHHGRERKLLSRDNGICLSRQLDHRGLPTGSGLHSVSASDIEESLLNSRGDNGLSRDIVDDLSEKLVDSMLGEDEPNEKTETSTKKKHRRDKDFRSDARGKWILSQRMRNSRRLIECPRHIVRLNTPFLAIYESLIPAEEEKAKQKQLLTLLEKLVCKEWPNARLYVYGSCANSFGFSKSDFDVCIAMDDQDINKSEVLLKLADILQSDNLQNVQALTRARVPIVKLMDPVTGISCDICINNVLAVVNTKLLRDYAEIDVRLRQLAFLVKHWAKSRGVNETYQGTLSSYAYVLMCIHFLQQRNPPILPCLQAMDATYAVTVDDIECAYFDQVEKLCDFGARNRESIGQLVWAFFGYWAYSHDYSNSVISIRTGSTLSKQEKDWTRRIGNDRHLICIEDPFETSHDLGRVVDKHSIRVLREEFERAADIMQYDHNPCITLFEPYIPS